ncbi:hypothetical protein [Weissella soli]|nr:hypothetical protein [Weissella soli]
MKRFDKVFNFLIDLTALLLFIGLAAGSMAFMVFMIRLAIGGF